MTTDKIEQFNEWKTSPWVRFLIPLPAMLVLLVFGGLVSWGAYSADAIKVKFRDAARAAMKQEDLEKAKFYYSRLIGEGDEGSTLDQFNMVSVFLAEGDQQAALEQLERLAPDDKRGYPPAHLQRAALFQQAVAKKGNDQQLLNRYKWHLQNGAIDGSIQSDLMWANYHLAVDQGSEALLRLSAAAGRNPDLWFDIAGLLRNLGRNDDAKRALERAEKHARARLKDDPIDLTQRLRLAEVLMIREQYAEVRDVLREGLRLNSGDPAMRRAASNFALSEFQRVDTANDADAEERRQFLLLQEAIQQDPENPAAYGALTAFYTGLEFENARAEYRKTLQEWISQGLAVPYAHFSLGNILWLENEQERAIFHFEKALELDKSLSVIANNLAWVLAHADQPDHSRAERLIRSALESDPDQIRFRDTFAAVLFKQEKYEEALVEYERTLPQTQGDKRKEAHERLAVIYEKLGQAEMAESHRKRLKELANGG